ncbi:class I SAM-dependent methyltransferase [Ochrobactrum sp. 3-3]|uniref:class I SAM-dependent methyltransferase n=1 Tax=Ochrobactrum sp. 3-3 TaxID=1830124 RepID=UPI0013B3EC99|nr:class I SAM-dependent methyltransferase [Ochrobactrum sp. 3-3]
MAIDGALRFFSKLKKTRSIDDHIQHAQRLLSEALPNSGYANRYKQEEIDYWSEIANWLPLMRKGSSILDIGCAYGTLSIISKNACNADVYACDAIEQTTIRNILAPLGIKYGFCNIELDDIPWDMQFDVVLFTEVIEHLNFHPLETLRKIRSSLKRGGSLMISTPDAESDWGRKTTYYRSLNEMPMPNRNAGWIDDHIWQFSMNELTAVLREAGFTIKKATHSRRIGFKHLNVWAIAN